MIAHSHHTQYCLILSLYCIYSAIQDRACARANPYINEINVIIIVLQINIEQYGTTNLTLPLNVFDCFSEGQASGAAGTGIKKIGMVKSGSDTTIQGFGISSGKRVAVGTADNTILAGTVRIFADLTGEIGRMTIAQLLPGAFNKEQMEN